MEQLNQVRVYYCRDDIEQEIDDVEHDLEHIQLQLQTYTYSPERYESHEEFDIWRAKATFSLNEKAREIRRLERVLRKFDAENSQPAKQEKKINVSTQNSLGNFDPSSKISGFFDRFSLKPKL